MMDIARSGGHKSELPPPNYKVADPDFCVNANDEEDKAEEEEAKEEIPDNEGILTKTEKWFIEGCDDLDNDILCSFEGIYC